MGRVTGSTALAMATACLKSDFHPAIPSNSGRHRETRPPASKGIQTAGRPWWDLGRQGRSPAAPTGRPRRSHRCRTWRGAPRTTEPRSMSGRRSIRAIARARWQAGMPHDGAPWMVLRLIQLADDLPHIDCGTTACTASMILSPTRSSRSIARPSHHAASPAIAAVTPRFVPKSVPNIPRDVCQTRINRSGPPESRGDELLGHADGIRMDTAGPVTAAYDPCSHGSAAIV